jgi:hypothetical protein
MQIWTSTLSSLFYPMLAGHLILLISLRFQFLEIFRNQRTSGFGYFRYPPPTEELVIHGRPGVIKKLAATKLNHDKNT